MSMLLTLVLGGLLVFVGMAMVRARDLFTLIVMMSAFSGVLMAFFTLLGAVDVAFTEAVVGASISTLFFVMLLHRIKSNRLRPQHTKIHVPSLLAAMGVGLVLLAGVAALPPFGDQDSAMQNHVASYFVANAYEDMRTPNVVTAVLADYRGYDTLIETAVVFTAAVACLLILGGPRQRKEEGES